MGMGGNSAIMLSHPEPLRCRGLNLGLRGWSTGTMALLVVVPTALETLDASGGGGGNTPRSYVYSCPEGHNAVGPDGLCIRRISSALAGLSEPSGLAFDPNTVDRFVIGVNALYPAADVRCPGMPGEWAGLLVTEDNGTAWELRCTPLFKGTAPDKRVDPTYIFDSQGRLHGSVLDISTAGDARFIQYLRYNFSSDIWTTKHNLTPDGAEENDRPFIALAPDETVVVTHDNYTSTERTTGIAWRTPSGWRWAGTESGCYQPRSRAVFEGTVAYVGCNSTAANTTAVARFNLSSGAWTVDPAFDNSTSRPMIGRLPDGRFALAYDATHYRIGSLNSTTGEIAWGTSYRVEMNTSGMFNTQLYAFEVDPWGSLHFIAQPSNSARAVHAVVEADTGAVLATTLLHEGESCSALMQTKNDYGDIEFRDGSTRYGIITWSRDGCIEYAMIEPRW